MRLLRRRKPRWKIYHPPRTGHLVTLASSTWDSHLADHCYCDAERDHDEGYEEWCEICDPERLSERKDERWL